MAAISGAITTFNDPNFVGELFKVTPTDTPFLSMIGGLTGGRGVMTKEFTWQTVDNYAPAQTVALEGADPTYTGRSRSELKNVLQIMQYGVSLSYTDRAAIAQLGAGGGNPSVVPAPILGDQPVGDPLGFQLGLTMERAATDVEYSFLQGTYAYPDVNTATNERKTRGLSAAITTNAVAAGATALSKTHIDSLMKQMADSGAPFRNVVLFANSFNRQAISGIYGYAPADRNVGGLSIKQIETDFAQLGVVYDRHMPTDSIFAVDVTFCAPVFMSIPDKGHFFLEELAHTGSKWNYQLYGEIGLQYGPELWHGKITGLTTS